jgi:tight adherence protein C
MFYLIIAAVFLASALLVAAVLYPLLTRGSTVRERLEKMMPDEDKGPAFTIKTDAFQDLLGWMGKSLPMSSADQSQYARMLVAAGYRKERTLLFMGAKLLLTVGLPCIYLIYLSVPGRGILFSFESVIILLILAISGYLLPTFWLRRMVANRQREIFHSLPDVLDLLTVCVEAGLGMDAGLIKVSEDPQFYNNPLARELRQTSKEIMLGMPRVEALRQMGERTMVDDIKSFALMLIQTERYGTSLGLAMRVHSDSLRTMRRQRAEEAAAKTTVKMLFPLAVLIFPALLVVILGPTIIKLSELFK